MRNNQSARDDSANFERVFRERMPAVKHASRALHEVMGIAPGTKMIGHCPVILWELPEPPPDTLHTHAGPKEVQSVARSTQLAESHECEDESESEDTDEGESEGESDYTDEDSGYEEGSEGPDEMLWNENADGRGYGPVYDESIEEIEDDESDSSEDLEEVVVERNRLSVPTCKGKNSQDPHSVLEARKRKRDDSPLIEPPSLSLRAKKPRVVIDLTDSPSPKEAEAARQQTAAALQTTLKPPQLQATSVARFASPPTLHSAAPSDLKIKRPIFWSSQLSTNIRKWLEQGYTKSCQTRLQLLDLRTTATQAGSQAHLGFSAKDHDKIKLSRLQLPTSAQPALAPPRPLDWIVVEVKFKGGTGDTPFWIMAFPLQAVTDIKVEHKRLPPVQARPQGRSTGGGLEAVYVTTLVLGKAGRVPLMHGRGVNDRFAEPFITACAEGKGVIELTTTESVPLGGCRAAYSGHNMSGSLDAAGFTPEHEKNVHGA